MIYAHPISDRPLRWTIWALPFAFALHNLEETFGMETWSHRIPAYVHAPVNTPQFAFAVAVFTILGFFVVFLRRVYPSEELYFKAIGAFAGMLFLNAFLPHLLATLYFGYYAPGVLTAVFINIPLTAFVALRTVALGRLSRCIVPVLVFVGGITGIILAASLLRLGALLTG